MDSSRKAGGQRTGRRKARPGARRLAPKPAAESGSARVIVVTAEQRQHLIEDAAYFRAERFRQIEPGNCRRQDLCDAEVEIEAVLKKHKRK
ncbi:MAG: hypothetical protein A3F74_02480 [Betaproteobacteria bacterium RIFCSPLOWO2_12_FULL_62_58]|nr:MAG: hypothetical protein A3I62_05245 [Betaproteobacteria bacterium RIFCSPLOWO2_02_FULL_62_79]OGA53650.1 MAG: hypothetical protein A3F74_02480 [Betaproteobacteria bacterium RIFCSPLOWO2_12_FULL_62_58]